MAIPIQVVFDCADPPVVARFWADALGYQLQGPPDPDAEWQAWLVEHGLSCHRLAGPGGATVALTCEVPGGRPGPRFVLDACLDTAPFGDEAAWTYPPASGQITRGWPQR